ncbi:PstS family phosphate ABC transporter substrate-binding protein [Saccharicrinis fermentans]|uniref:Phosphate-binding protein PstS n=1 Tax=Saccharicrinis fermentans DSM 9555 = JCM 21142 TaxID=869213 RepID=W7YKS6_9BACT|nr:substrate-binding domain-containing protein [Saccharicrinis fermentans]GAF02964.1 phosphate-binding protein PstS precursor [Saccharicrinis fermentans DSM 9555 = JCM 21142]
MKKTKSISITLLSLILISACSSQSSKNNTINISGAFALYPLVVKWSEEYQKTHPDIRFNISGGGAGKGMADALSGAVDLGMFSREITPSEMEKGVWWVSLCTDAVVPTISKRNPYLDSLKKRGLTKAEFKAIFITKSISSWDALLAKPSQHEISVYTRSDACGAAETWAKYLGTHQENIKGIGIYGDPGLAEAVSKDPAGIAFNNTIFAYNINTGKKQPGIELIPIDINENGKIDAEEDCYNTFCDILQAIANGIYPAPPARQLYFVANGKPPEKTTCDFIKWTLTEGQAYVKEAGYVPMSDILVKQSLKKLNAQ